MALELLDWTLWMSTMQLNDAPVPGPQVDPPSGRSLQVLVVDDDSGMCEFLRAFLSERGYSVIAVASAEEAVTRYRAERPAAVILDIMLSGMDGLEALTVFKKIDRDVPIIVLSGQGRTATVVQAMKLGASDFVSKPFDDADLEVPLAHAVKQWQRTREMASLREQLHSQEQDPLPFGHSEKMADVRDLVERASETDVPVLIRGERGTGKARVARALHTSSLRKDKPFVMINCAALPNALLESELFGCERGAVAGAMQQKPGKFEFANHGTIFIAEIGGMSMPLQGKLLQVLQHGEFSRAGGKHDVPVDVRVIAATNQDLEHAVGAGTFLEDLFGRLNGLSIHLPPLRERRDEVPALADYFLKKYSVEYKKHYEEISTETLHLLTEYDWPGNISELSNLIERAVVVGSEGAIRKEISHAFAMAHHRATVASPARPHPAPPPSERPATAAPPARPASPSAIAATAGESGNLSLKDISRTAAREVERELILKVLEQTRWNRKETAEILGISYKALLYKIKESGLDKAS